MTQVLGYLVLAFAAALWTYREWCVLRFYLRRRRIRRERRPWLRVVVKRES